MQVDSFSALETEVLSAIGRKINTFETLLSEVSFGERLLSQTIESLLSRNKIKFDIKSKQYAYQLPIEGEMIILDGNLLLPMSIIRFPEKGILYVTRGCWYEFPIDFDIRRIIWNVKLVGTNNSSLVDMIKTSVLKERRTRIKHNPEYDNIRNKVVPYKNNVCLLLNAIGDDVAAVSIQFRIFLDKSDSKGPVFRTFTVPSEISTKELVDELHKPIAERNYGENISINLIYNFSDFIFKDNEIPIRISNEGLQFVKIASIKKGYELHYYNMNASDGFRKKIDTEYYENPVEALEKLKIIFNGLPTRMLVENNFNCELEN